MFVVARLSNAARTDMPFPSAARVRLAWTRDGHDFEAVEPDVPLLEQHAERLRDWYNAPENASTMDGSGNMSRQDVLEFWYELRRSGGRGFFGFVDGDLVGDADLRNIDSSAATGEFAVMIGGATQKGRGVGRALSMMVHVFAFRELSLDRLYVPPRLDNARVHALNAFLGYERDDSPAARAFADSPDCETYSIGSAAFQRRHADAWREVVSVTLSSPAAGLER
ncbi:MAG TPA: GNAT family N-acetyltransferase [Labilithrix sp.]|nr:GNAT family N-acetyltransferase [Labilithrix sp.]